MAASTALSPDVRLTVWAISAALYLAGIAFVYAEIPGELESAVAVTDSLIERFGLFVIIVLGDTVTGVVSGLTSDPTDARKLVVGLVCVLVGFGAWWTYFDFVGHHPPRNIRTSVVTWLVGHLPIGAAIAAMGATMPVLVTHAREHRTAAAPAWMMCVSAAVVLTFHRRADDHPPGLAVRPDAVASARSHQSRRSRSRDLHRPDQTLPAGLVHPLGADIQRPVDICGSAASYPRRRERPRRPAVAWGRCCGGPVVGLVRRHEHPPDRVIATGVMRQRVTTRSPTLAGWCPFRAGVGRDAGQPLLDDGRTEARLVTRAHNERRG
jgi:hypothetical protein